MVETFFRGTILGFSLSVFFIGPAFFALIQTSIKNGFRSAAAMALGINISDAILVFLAYLGAAQFLGNPTVKLYEGIGGSVVLLIYGIYEFFQKHTDEKEAKIGLEALENINKNKRLPLVFVKGFLLNILNPFVFFMWIASMTSVSSRYNTKEDLLSFFTGTLGVILILDLLKALGANRLKKIITHKVMLFIHYIMAIALIISGIVLLYLVLAGKNVG